MFHSLALLVISGHPRLMGKRFAAGSIAVGSALFSGSIYALILAKTKDMNIGKILGPVTPIGGMSCPLRSTWLIAGSIMLVGWIALVL